MGFLEKGKWWGLRCGAALVMISFVVYTVTMNSQRYYNFKWTRGSSHSQGTDYNGHESHKTSTEAYSSTASGKQNITSYRRVDRMTTSLATISTESMHPTRQSVNGTEYSSPMLESLAIPSLGKKFTPLHGKDITDVKTFVIFVGFARSGHSIVGSQMDAHPDMIIAHEYNVLKNIKKQFTSKNGPLSFFNSLYRNSHDNAVNGWRSEKDVRKGYSLSMSQESWQGRVRRLRVIGDKAGSMTIQEHKRDPTKCLYLVDKVQGTLGISVKAIRVLRNPYDNIATRFLYSTKKSKQKLHVPRNSSEIGGFKKHAITTNYISKFLKLVSMANKIITDCHLPVLDVHLSDLIGQPMSVMRDICDYVGVECSVEYLELCAGKLFQSLSKTRSLVKWSQEQIDNVMQNIRRYSEFSRYSYDCDC